MEKFVDKDIVCVKKELIDCWEIGDVDCDEEFRKEVKDKDKNRLTFRHRASSI